MYLRGIMFDSIMGASGVQGFFQEGYWFHRWLKMLGILNLNGLGFVAKTATALPRNGNMPLRGDFTPQELFPSCIKIRPYKGVMLNAVGLSNPGLPALIKNGSWQMRSSPFMISIMAVGKTQCERAQEMSAMAEMLTLERHSFRSPFAIQVNLSCPNTGHDGKEMFGESADALRCLQNVGLPIVPKFSVASASPEAVCRLAENVSFDAICVSNTIPFSWQHESLRQPWGVARSPLEHLGGGGISGGVLLPIVLDWIKKVRSLGFSKPIHGGGGIMSAKDVLRYHEAGASSVFIGSVVALRPWRVGSIIRQAVSLMWR